VGLFGKFGAGKSVKGQKAAQARELAGDLEAATLLYVEAGLPDEAARVLLLRADGEPQPERRVAFCAQAARTAASVDLRKKALARKGRLSLDLLKAQGAARVKSELAAVAHELEEAGELELAADAFALAGDSDAEVRVLTAAGAIERLEERLRAAAAASRVDRERSSILERVGDLDQTGERRAALELADKWLAENEDEAVAHAARAIRARILRGPVVELEIDGTRQRCAFGRDVVIGRGDATIVIASRAVSRRHVRLFRGPSGPMVEDMATRNGTTLAGARLSGPIAIGDGLRLELGTGVPCALAVVESGAVAVEIAGERYVAPLGPLALGEWTLDHEVVGDASFVVLRAPSGVPRPVLAGYSLGERAELCAGDEITLERGGAVKIRAPGTAAVSAGRRSSASTGDRRG
jgi:hypothetical protein